MPDWGQRAKDRDRDEAIRLINDAAARGQIVAADKDKRIQEVKSAQTVGEVELLTRGLAAAPAVTAGAPSDPPPVSSPAPPVAPTFQPYTPPTTGPVTEPDTTGAPPLPPANVQYGEPLSSSGGTSISTPPMIKRGGGGGKLVLILVLCIVAGVAVPIIFGIKALVDGVDSLDDIVSDGKADVYSDDGFADMVAEVEDQTGSTQVWEVSLYDTYAVLYVPTQTTGKRFIAYRYDGLLSEFTKGSRTSDEESRFDLADVDVAVLRKLRDQARALVEDPNSSYVIVRSPFIGSGPPQVLAYASNEFGESGFLEANLNGKVTAKHPPT